MCSDGGFSFSKPRESYPVQLKGLFAGLARTKSAPTTQKQRRKEQSERVAISYWQTARQRNGANLSASGCRLEVEGREMDVVQ
jgi:hypothetical protein